MTNAEIIQAIRKEIERLESIEYPCDNSQQATGFFNALDRMTDFLSTLEAEEMILSFEEVDKCPKNTLPPSKECDHGLREPLESERPEPYNPVYDEAYLNEKIKKATESWKGVDVDAMLAECRGYDEEKSEKPNNHLEGLDDAAKNYALNTAEDSEQYSARYLGYKDGAKWQKEQDEKELSEKIASAYQLGLADKEKQMMKEAVEGEYDFYPAAVYLDVPIPRMNHGDKVRIIVIPNTDEK